MSIMEELPFTNEALKMWIDTAEKEMQRLYPSVSEYNKLKRRVKIANKRLDEHHNTPSMNGNP